MIYFGIKMPSASTKWPIRTKSCLIDRSMSSSILTLFEMLCLLKHLEIRHKNEELFQTITKLAEKIPLHITSNPSIWSLTVSVIICELGDVEWFEESEQLETYAFIMPKVYETR